MFVCLQAAARELILQPWASKQPSFFAELLRLTQFITTTEVHQLTITLPGSIILVLRNNMKVHIIKMDFISEISRLLLSHSAGELLCGSGFRWESI